MANHTKKDWSRSEVQELIRFYRNRPELWDVKNKGYRKKAKKLEALEEIADSLSTTVEEISRKIHRLRNQFNHELKKTLKRKSEGNGEESYQSKWQHYKDMAFLQDILFVRPARKHFLKDASLDDDNSDNDIETIEISTVDKKTAREDPLQMVTTVSGQDEDEYDIFGKFIASELRSKNSEYFRKKLKRKIHQVILEITEEEEEDLLKRQTNNVSSSLPMKPEAFANSIG